MMHWICYFLLVENCKNHFYHEHILPRMATLVSVYLLFIIYYLLFRPIAAGKAEQLKIGKKKTNLILSPNSY